MRRALFAVAAMLLLAGCRAAPRGVTIIASVPCLPPGVRGDFFGWPVVAFQPIVLRQEAGDDVEARIVRYQHGRDAVTVVWVGSDLVAVDPSPDTSEPDWVDDSLVMDDELTLRARPEAPCQWRRHKSAT
ncbi:MAG: hypothetical protein DMD80_07565 [Candidatus Rokuibacteriota bacterium]|nr:MAG: hypothetical protein DMD80_07565 [Candidatus Rokubacteria bacterium]